MLKEFLTSIADKLRELLGTADTINAQNFTSKIDDVYDAGYEKGKSEGGVQHSDYINPEWTDWRYFSYSNNRNDLVAKLKYSDTSNGTDFSYMFYRCSKLTNIPEIDTSNGTNFNYMFDECSQLTNIPEIDTSNGTNFGSMFYGCSALQTIPQIDTSNGTIFSYMFMNCQRLSAVHTLDISNGTNFNYLFGGCKSLETIPQTLDTSNGTNFGSMFMENKITEVPEMDTSKGTTFSQMFNKCANLVTIPKLNMSSMTSSSNMSSMFASCNALENVTFEGTIKITANTSVFSNSPKLTVESLMSFINALSDNTGVATTYTVTIGSTNLAKLTDEQKQVAYDKNIALA